MLLAHDRLVQGHWNGQALCGQHPSSPWAVAWLMAYSIWVLAWRLVFHPPPEIYRSSVFYEYCWLCNATLILSALGLATNRPILGGACCVAVGIDQLLWYVDLSVYFSTGRFPIGVAKYVVWKGTAWTTQITCTHHLWTIPLVLVATGGLHWLSWPLSMVVMTVSVLMSRWLVPARVQSEGLDTKYLNVNLGHEVWKDIQMPMLQINADDPSAAVYLFRLLWRWAMFNSLVFGVLYRLSALFISPSPPLC